MGQSVVERILAIKNTTFMRHAATLSGGQIAAAGIPIAAAPILGRLYLPTDYGLLASYMAIAGILSIASTLQLQHGILATRFDQHASRLAALCNAVTFAVSLATLIVGGAIFGWALGQDDAADVEGIGWFMLLPLSVLGSGLVATSAALGARGQRYSAMARIPVFTILTTVSVSIVLGWRGWGVHGLFVSYLLGQIVNVAAHRVLLRPAPPAIPNRRTSYRRRLALFRRHRRFVTHVLPAELMNALSLQMPIFALSAVGALPLIGALSRARQVALLPLSLIGSPIATVFRQRASERLREGQDCKRVYLQTFCLLGALGFVPTLLLLLFGPEIFRFVLGPNWEVAGEVAAVLAPMAALRLIASPLSGVLYVGGGERAAFRLSVLTLAAVVLGCWLPLSWGAPADSVIYGFAIAYSAAYLVHLASSWRIASRPRGVRQQ